MCTSCSEAEGCDILLSNLSTPFKRCVGCSEPSLRYWDKPKRKLRNRSTVRC
ncbi:Uncharacterised protein [Vibrio cholerae]|nr:Uncharacterised protein [Vibrio cholerae]